MKRYALIFICLLVIISILQCKKDEAGPADTGTNPVQTAVSKLVHTSEEGTVTHSNGAFVNVPKGAVPMTATGAEGEMLFTIDAGSPVQFGAPANPPPGMEYVGNVCSMGPEGFIFAEPVHVSMPIPSGVDPATHVIKMYDFNRQTSAWVELGGMLNAQKNAIELDAIHLCTNMLMSTVWTDSACGAILFQALPGYTFKACIESYTLKYPVYDRNFVAAGRVRHIDRADASTSGDGKFYWRLPQGDYVIDVEVYIFDSQNPSDPPRYLGYFRKNISINSPHFNWRIPGSPDYEYAVFFGDLTPYIVQSALTSGPAPCWLSPTSSVGIGEINVRLEWNAEADLDLWVYDPCNNRIYWVAKSATCQSSLGQLDLDNQCGDFVMSRPENIFWRSNPPRGTYRMTVHYFSDCATTGTTYFTVRWWVRGVVYTYRGSVSEYDTVGVGQFTY